MGGSGLCPQCSQLPPPTLGGLNLRPVVQDQRTSQLAVTAAARRALTFLGGLQRSLATPETTAHQETGRGLVWLGTYWVLGISAPHLSPLRNRRLNNHRLGPASMGGRQPGGGQGY